MKLTAKILSLAVLMALVVPASFAFPKHQGGHHRHQWNHGHRHAVRHHRHR